MLDLTVRRLKKALLTLVAPHRLSTPATILGEVPPPSPAPQLRTVFDSYREASAVCRQDYQEPGLIKFLSTRNAGATFDMSTLTTPAMLATFDALRRAHRGGDDPIRVLDVGGAFGAHLEWAKHHLPFTFKWAVTETSALVAETQPRDSLAFFSRMQEGVQWLGGEVDLLLGSGVLQYFKEPVGILKDMSGLRPQYILLSRTIVSLGRPLYEIQQSRLFDNGPGPVPEGFEDTEVRMIHVYHRESDILTLMTNHELVYKVYEGPPRLLEGEHVRDGAIYLFRHV